MSELIDSIFDVSKISGEVTVILTEMTKSKTAISGVADEVQKLTAAFRSSKSSDDLVKNSKILNDHMVNGEKAVKTYKTELEKLQEKTNQLTGAEKASNIEIAKARLELTAAQKEIKATAAAEIEASSKTMALTTSYNALQRDLKASMIAYKDLSKSERESARGKEMLSKIASTQTSLKDMDAGMKVYSRNVGNYASALDGISGGIDKLIPGSGVMISKLIALTTANTETAASTTVATTAIEGEAAAGATLAIGMGAAEKGAAGMAIGNAAVGASAEAATTGIWAMTKALLANPIVLIGAAIVAVFMLLKNAITSNGEATGKLNQILAPFKILIEVISTSLGKMASVMLDGVLAVGKFIGKIAALIPGLDKINEKAKEAIDLKKQEQKLNSDVRDQIVQNAKDELSIIELKSKSKEKDNYTTAERIKMLKEANALELKMNSEKVDIATRQFELKKAQMKEEGKSYKDLTGDEKTAYKESEANIYNTRKEFFANTMRLKKQLSTEIKELASEQKEAEKEAIEAAEKRTEAEKENAQKILEASRRLTDSKLALMTDGEEKQIAISEENLNRQLEDLKANGQLTNELEKNLTKAHGNDIQKIKDDFAKQAEEKRKADLEKALADFEKNTQKEVELISADYRQKESNLKKEYAKGKKSKEWYEAELLKIQEEAAIKANAKTIERLQKELETANIPADKKEEISNKITALQIENENLVTDAVIKGNEKQAESEKEKGKKILETAEKIASAGMELYSAIGDFEKQQSEERLAELDKQQKASDDYFTGRQKNLDNAIMSDGSRVDAQKKIDQDKAKQDKILADKVHAEKVKQAKWEKAQNLVNAIMGGAMAQVAIWSDTTMTTWLKPVFAILAGATAAVSIAKIASAKIPEYATGTDNHPGGWSIWGEKQTEVAIDPIKGLMFAENPTLTNFNPGTRIFQTVEEFQKNMNSTNQKGFEIDYNKMGDSIASRMPGLNVNLDSRGLWSEINKQGDRRTVINRRFQIGN